MQESGMNIDSSGGVISAEDMRENRRKRGQCVSCGQKCHEKRVFPFKSTPLTIPGLVLNGRCLTCNPIEDNPNKSHLDLGKAISTLEVANALSRKVRKRTGNKARSNTVSSGSSDMPIRRDSAKGSNSTRRRGSDSEITPNDRVAAMNTAKDFKSMGVIQNRTHSSSSRRASKTKGLNRPSMAELDDSIKWTTTVENIEEQKMPSTPDVQIIDEEKENFDEDESKPAADLSFHMSRQMSLSETNTEQKQPDIESILRIIKTSSSVVEIIHIMQENSNTIDIQREACKALGSSTLSPSDQSSVAEHGGLIAVIRAMVKYPRDQRIQESSCQALWNLSATESNQIEIAKNGGIGAIIDSMKHFQQSSSLQEKAVAALSNLGAVELNQISILQHGGVTAIVDAMNNNLGDVDVQEKGCAAITNLANRSKEIKTNIAQVSGINAIIHAMMFHEADPELQENALKALRNMCANDEENKKLVAAEGGISYVICAMQNHRDHTGVQEQGCWTLSNLAANKDNKIFIGENGGIDCIILAMWNHFDKPAVQEWGCRALWTLSVDANNKKTVAKLGGIGAVVNAMRTHQNEAAVQEKGCGVFVSLASNSDENKIKIVNDEGLDVIVMAMIIHEKKKSVQDRACSALKRLACAANLTSFETFGIPNLLLQAKESFPKECGKKVDEIMNLMFPGK